MYIYTLVVSLCSILCTCICIYYIYIYVYWLNLHTSSLHIYICPSMLRVTPRASAKRQGTANYVARLHLVEQLSTDRVWGVISDFFNANSSYPAVKINDSLETGSSVDCLWNKNIPCLLYSYVVLSILFEVPCLLGEMTKIDDYIFSAGWLNPSTT